MLATLHMVDLSLCRGVQEPHLLGSPSTREAPNGATNWDSQSLPPSGLWSAGAGLIASFPAPECHGLSPWEAHASLSANLAPSLLLRAHLIS